MVPSSALPKFKKLEQRSPGRHLGIPNMHVTLLNLSLMTDTA